MHTEVREISRAAGQARCSTSKSCRRPTNIQPGQHAKVKLKLTDEAGKPFVGSTVLSIFDKSLEYISGGANVADINEFFWKWRRQHQPQSETNLDRWFDEPGAARPNETAMENLGVFGDTVADDDVEGTADRRIEAPAAWLAGGARMTRLSAAVAMAADGAPAAPMAGRSAGRTGHGESRGAGRRRRRRSSSRRSAASSPTRPSGSASLETNNDGMAEVELDMPENLTAWKIHVWAMGHGTRVGEGVGRGRHAQELIVRMQAPRFFVETDEVVLSANVHNYLPTAKQVQVRLELEGNTLEAARRRWRRRSKSPPAASSASIGA